MGKISVLIVDDDEALADALVTKFGNLGYETTVAKDGNEAIKMLSEQSFDVMLTDLHMPNKSGVEVLKAVKDSKNPNIPSYVITNLGSDHYCEEALQNGALECFVKSRVTLNEVVQIIEDKLKS